MHLASQPSTTPAQVGSLHITLLGHMAVASTAGVSLLPTGAKTRALLAVLALSARRPVARTWLAELLWCRRGPEQARASLRQEIHRLLGVLEPLSPPVLDVQRHTLALRRAGIRVDTDAVLAATPQTVLDLPETLPPLLEDLGALDGAFRTWLDGERARLASHIRHQLETLLADAPDLATIKEAARRLLLLNPLHEAAWRARIKAETRNGEEGDALSSARACLDTFQNALGSLPGQETMRLITDLRAAHDRNACAPAAPGSHQSSRLRAMVFLTCAGTPGPHTRTPEPAAGPAASIPANVPASIPASISASTVANAPASMSASTSSSMASNMPAGAPTGMQTRMPDGLVAGLGAGPSSRRGTEQARMQAASPPDAPYATNCATHYTPERTTDLATGRATPHDVPPLSADTGAAAERTHTDSRPDVEQSTRVAGRPATFLPARGLPASGLPLAEQFRDELTLNLAVHDLFDLSLLPERLPGTPAPAQPYQRQADFLIGITLTDGDRDEIRCTLQAFDTRRNDAVLWGQRVTVGVRDISEISHRLAATLVTTLIVAAARHVADKPDSALSPMEKGLRAFILTVRADATQDALPDATPPAPAAVTTGIPASIPAGIRDGVRADVRASVPTAAQANDPANAQAGPAAGMPASGTTDTVAATGPADTPRRNTAETGTGSGIGSGTNSDTGTMPDGDEKTQYHAIERLIGAAQASSPEDPFLFFVHAHYLLCRLHDDWGSPAAQTARHLNSVLRRGLAITPASVPCRYLLAAGLFHAGELGEAQALLGLMHDASRIDSRWGMLAMLDALSALCAGDAVTAARLYGEFFSLATPLPGTLLPSQNFILSCFLAGRHADTLRHAQGLLAVNPWRTAVLVPAMAAANSLGYQDLVRDYHNRIRARHPDLTPQTIEQHYSYVPRSLRHQLLAAMRYDHGHAAPKAPMTGREHHADAWRDRPERI
ncbi:MAG: BTAD domain-containing putative transcriptional regulator [Acetobacter sp.]